MTASSRTTASRLRLRPGVPDDLPTLLDIDNDAGTLFVQAGLDLDLPETHEFHVSERERWSSSLAGGRTLVAIDAEGAAMGFVALGRRDGHPFVEQLSVRCAVMRRGLGRTLLEAAGEIARADGARQLWLSTYDHLAFNRPWYERHGFMVVPEESCGEEVVRTLHFERRWLPVPHARVVMRRELGASA